MAGRSRALGVLRAAAPRLPLQTRLALFGAALVLAGVGATAAAGWRLIDREAERTARLRLTAASEFAVAEYENLLENARITGEVLAARLSPQSLQSLQAGQAGEDVSSLVAIVRNARRTDSGDTIAVIAPDGTVLVEVGREGGASRGGQWPGSEAVAAALAGGAAQGVEVFPGGGLRAVAVLPVRAGGAVAGAVGVTSFLDDEVAARLQRVTGFDVAFLTVDDVVAAAPGRGRHAYLLPHVRRLWGRLTAGESAEVEVAGPFRREVVYFAPLRDTTGDVIGTVAVAAGIDVLGGQRRETLALFGAVVAAVLALALGTNAYAARALGRPLARLVEAVRRIGAGDLTTPVSATATGAGSGFDAGAPPRERPDEVGELAAAVEDMRRRLAAAAQNQAQLTRLKDEYLFSVAHELRSPLTALTASVEVLAESDDGLSPAERHHFVEIVRRHAATLRALVENLLDLGSLRAGRFRVEPRPTPADAVLDAALEEVAPHLQARGQRVAVRMAQPAPTAMADPRRLRQVLVNLLSNAAKYGPEQDVVEVAVEERDGAIRFEVADHGPGIPSEERARLFEAYFRRESTSRAAPGVGLGLAIVKAIVDAHGGEVGVESGADRGTRIWISLPSRPSLPAASPPLHPDAPAPDAGGGAGIR